MILSQLSSLGNNFSVNQYFVKDVIDIAESKVVSSSNSQSLKFGEISVPEEPSGLC